MLFNKQILSSLTRFSLLPLSFFVSLGVITDSSFLAVRGDAAEEFLLAQTSPPSVTLANGIYLYGRSPQPEQLGQEYMVFKVDQGKIVGAMYVPQSEFDCFSGTLRDNYMNLSMIDPNDGTPYAYTVPLKVDSTIASNAQMTEVGLEGYHRLNKVSDNDHRILKSCL